MNTICHLDSWHIMSVSTLILRENLIYSILLSHLEDKTGINACIASHFCQFYANQMAKNEYNFVPLFHYA